MQRGAASCPAVGRNLGWQKRGGPWSLTTLPWVKAPRIWRLEISGSFRPVVQVSFWRCGLQAATWAGMPGQGFLQIGSCSHVTRLGKPTPQQSAKIWQKGTKFPRIHRKPGSFWQMDIFWREKTKGLITFPPKSSLVLFYFILTSAPLQQKTGMWERMWWYGILLLTVSRVWQLLNCVFFCHEKILN